MRFRHLFFLSACRQRYTNTRLDPDTTSRASVIASSNSGSPAGYGLTFGFPNAPEMVQKLAYELRIGGMNRGADVGISK